MRGEEGGGVACPRHCRSSPPWPGLCIRRPLEPSPGPQIRIVQPNIGQQDKWNPNYRRDNFLRLARLSGRPSATPRLVLWPEAATPDLLSVQPDARRRYRRR